MPNQLFRWLKEHRGQDWAVIIIYDDLTGMFIREETETFRFSITDPYAFSGIHVRDLLVIVDFEEKPDYVRDMVSSITTSKNSRVVSTKDA